MDSGNGEAGGEAGTGSNVTGNVRTISPAMARNILDTPHVDDMTARINLELLDEVERAMKSGIAAWFMAHPGQSPENFRYVKSLDGWNQCDWRIVRGFDEDFDEVNGSDPAERCETAYCVAGWAATIDAARVGSGGWVTTAEDASAGRTFGHVSWLFARPDDNDRDVGLQYGSHGVPIRVISAEHRAIRVLGLTNDEALLLFTGSNTLQTVRGAMATLRAEEKIRRRRAERHEAITRLTVQGVPRREIVRELTGYVVAGEGEV